MYLRTFGMVITPIVNIGIDPGKRGGIAIHTPLEKVAFRMPLVDANLRPMTYSQATSKDKKLSKSRKCFVKDLTINTSQIEFIINKSLIDGDIFAFIEQQQARSRQGGQLAIGRNFGLIEGVLRGLHIPYTIVTSQEWKKELNISTKDDSLELCEKLGFPLDGKHDGVAESHLIAYYGSQLTVGG